MVLTVWKGSQAVPGAARSNSNNPPSLFPDQDLHGLRAADSQDSPSTSSHFGLDLSIGPPSDFIQEPSSPAQGSHEDADNPIMSGPPASYHPSDTGRPPGTRPHVPPTQPRRQPVRPPYQTPHRPIFSSVSSSDSVQTASLSFHGPASPQYQVQSPRAPPYSPSAGYGPPYTTVSPQQSGSLAQAPTPPFAYPRGYPPGSYVHEASGMIPQNPPLPFSSPGMPPLLQHRSSSGPIPMYAHTHVSPSPPRSPLSSPSQPTHSSPYAPHSPYYTSPMSPQFSYPAQSYGPVYHSQYPHYPQHYVASPEQEGQTGWWYMAPPPMASGHVQSPYQSQLPVSYPTLNKPEMESYKQPGPSSPSPAAYATSSASRPGPYAGAPGPSAPPTASPAAPTQSAPAGSPASNSPGLGGSSGPSVSKPSPTDRARSRRPFHPNPPAHRSEWVMWVGNVPGDASYDELWLVFNRPLPASSTDAGLSPSAVRPEELNGENVYGGVSSIFLIARSNCAFVNFESERHLQAAIARFNGYSLRPNDPKCPRLVCRVRAREDDLKAGVGAQRGTGLHMRWLKEQKEKVRETAVMTANKEGEDPSASGSSDHVPSRSPSDSPDSPRSLAHTMAAMVVSDSDARPGGGRRPVLKDSSSGSYASTSSSVLTRHFPKRYFILKSLTQFDLDLSIEKGLWATQRHNEAVLDQAFRTSEDVYLIFGVNKSGEFYGYARMASPISGGGAKVSWASRSESSSSPRAVPKRSADDGSSPLPSRPLMHYFSPRENRTVDESPLAYSPSAQQLTPGAASAKRFLSAPAELKQPHSRFSMPSTVVPAATLSPHALLGALVTSRQDSSAPDDFQLNRQAVVDASHRGRTVPPRSAEPDEDGVKRTDMEYSASALEPVVEEPSGQDFRRTEDEEMTKEQWGEPFRIEWIRTSRLPFWRTRHLRNPWNHDREVKVSRDGTELEPGVGQVLLEEWDRPDPPQSPGVYKYPGQSRRSTSEPKGVSSTAGPLRKADGP